MSCWQCALVYVHYVFVIVTQALKLLMQCNYDTSAALQRLQVDGYSQSGIFISHFRQLQQHCSLYICAPFCVTVT